MALQVALSLTLQSKVVTQKLRVPHAQALGNRLVTEITCNCLLNVKKINANSGQQFVPNCREVAIPFLLSCD